MADRCSRSARDVNGDRIERRWLGGQEVIVHHTASLPPQDVTVVRGIPCTTPLRTVLDLAPEIDSTELDRMVRTSLERGLFTVAEAVKRIGEPDMLVRPGAPLLAESLVRVLS
jgi:hypothetical protein